MARRPITHYSRMAFVPRYEYDIFVSYAHVDDRPLVEGMSGWVAALVRNLKDEVARKMGRSDAVSIWFDAHSLRGHHTVDQEISGKLARTALFVAILSPGYVASQWCQDEAKFFAEASGDLSRRVFIVEKEPLDENGVRPPLLEGRRAYQLWRPDNREQPRTLAVPVPRSDDIDYFRQIEDLARDLRSQCRAMAQDGPAMRAVAVAPSVPMPVQVRGSVPTVLLAEVTDDLEFKRDEVRRYLEQTGIAVLPEVPYPLGRADFTAALDADLAESRLFIQLLGPMTGKRPRDIPDGYGWLQREGALRRGLPILQWRSPDLDLATIEWARHRELLETETVQATSLESFKRAIVDALAPPPPAPEPRQGTSERPLIFLNTEARQRAIAADIRNMLGDRVAWAEPLFEGPAEIVREDLEQNLIDCDAMVMVYTDNPGWARAQLRNFHKLTSRRERPVRAIPIIDAPPTEKPDLGFFLPEMVMIDGRGGIGPSAIEQLSASLLL